MSIYSQIMSNIFTACPELTNTSGAGIETKIASSIAPVIDNTITEINNTQATILDIIGNQRYLKDEYYIKYALAYQDGDNLITNPDTFDVYYAVIDTNKQIVKQAAFIKELSGDGNYQKLSLKIARLDPNTQKLAKLTDEQLIAFKAYYINYTAPGLFVKIFSFDPNTFSFNATVTFYSSYNLTLIKQNISAAIQNFRDTFVFNGTLFVNDLEAYLKKEIPGIRNVSLTTAAIDGVIFTDSVSLISGYFDYIANIENNFTYVSI